MNSTAWAITKGDGTLYGNFCLLVMHLIAGRLLWEDILKHHLTWLLYTASSVMYLFFLYVSTMPASHMNKYFLWSKIIWAALSNRSNQSFYDRISPLYDETFTFHRIHAQSIVNTLNELYRDKKEETLLLDLGCGTGMLSKLLAEQGFNVVGLDLSYTSLAHLKKQAPFLNVIQAEADDLPFLTGTFPVVVSLGAWRHFADIAKVLDEVSRVLSNNGIFIVGYFPADLAGLIPVKENCWGKALICSYQMIIKKLGYLDRVDFTLEEDTQYLADKKFKSVSNIESGLHKHLLVMKYPLSKNSLQQER